VVPFFFELFYHSLQICCGWHYKVVIFSLINKELVMKKMMIIFFMCWGGSFLNGMESNNDVRINVKGTLIVLTNKDIYRLPQEATTITVVGLNEQRMLQRPHVSVCGGVSDVFNLSQKKFYVKNEGFEAVYVPGSLEKPGIFVRAGDQVFKIDEAYKHVNQIQLQRNKILIGVQEPEIYLQKYWNGDSTEMVLYYHPKRRIGFKRFDEPEYYKNEASIEAQKDLSKCYENILGSAFQLFADGQERSITSPLLGRLFGFSSEEAAEAMVKSIFSYINDNKSQYSKIVLAVNSQEDFESCTKIINKLLK
jgi:hypothetical protein